MEDFNPENPKNKNLTSWKIEKFEKSKMEIKLTFSEPLHISTENVN